MARNYVQQTDIQAPAQFAFQWYERPGGFERLTPPWEDVRIEERAASLRDGERMVFAIRSGPIWQRWVAEMYGYQQNQQFCDRLVEGPFTHWEHIHRFEATGENSCRMEDRITYEIPMAGLGELAAGRFVRGRIRSGITYRAATARHDIECHFRYKLPPMKILITGSTGLVGSELVQFLKGGGHEVLRLVRGRTRAKEKSIIWLPKEGLGEKQLAELEGIDAVINLAGESIMGLWTEAKKRRIRDSRVIGTRHLAEGIAKLKSKPKVLINASAVGYYGDRGDEELTEESKAGSGFLADTGHEWEAATEPARDAGIRVVTLRTGIVMTPRGGALEAMLRPFRMGAGGKLGSGKQYTSWIAMDDLLGLILHCLATESVQGPVNATAPNPVRNSELTKTLARIVHRPAFFHVPRAVLKLTLRDLATEGLLASVRAIPRKADESGFQFAHPELEAALRHLLGKTK